MSRRPGRSHAIVRDARSGTIGTATQRRRARALWGGLRVTEIARQEGVTHSAISQSVSVPVIADALWRIGNDCERRRCTFAEWKATRLPELLERLGLTEA